MLAFIPIISALFPLLLQELANLKVISPSLANLIGGIETAAAPLIDDAASLTAPTIQAIFSSVTAALTVLQSQTTLSPTALLIAKAISDAATAGYAASQVTAVDPTLLKPEALIPAPVDPPNPNPDPPVSDATPSAPIV